MESIVKIFKTKLKLGKQGQEDEKLLRADLRYLACTLGGLNKGVSASARIEAFRDLLLMNKTVSNHQTLPDPNNNANPTSFNHLYRSHKALMNEVAEALKRGDLVTCDDLGPSVIKEKKDFVIGQYRIPVHIHESMEIGDAESYYKLGDPLTRKNYRERFQILLWIEEATQEISLRRYDMRNIQLSRSHGDSYKLKVPGLAEGRPSLLCGDKLILRAGKYFYIGFICDVGLNYIIVRMHSSLSSKVSKLSFNVFFQVNRTSFRRYHHAVNNPPRSSVLFPMPGPKLGSSGSPKKIKWLSRDVNQYQKVAVMNIIEARCRPAPYIIFGPPGTGKTITMVEAILQVYLRNPNGKILVCGNSNTCADSLAIRIKSSGVVEPESIIRVSAYNRIRKKLIPGEIQDITISMMALSQETYRDCSIVVTTCTQSCALNEFSEEFDYVFIDEAGHASEPEALIPIGLMKRKGCLVLAGDPHQLGPICLSQVAKRNGLGTSLLERLCKLPIYQRRVRQKNQAVYDERYLTKLIISYRADPRVMAVNDKLFYEKELVCRKLTPEKWLDVLKIKNPIAFQNVNGKDNRAYNGPSWFNANEAIMCICYAKRLYREGLKPSQLGIITPYRSQIKVLQQIFDLCQLDRCKIATIEEFQGDEREIIMISTVRSSFRNINLDQTFNLGFLFNPKLFNVAISRAKWIVLVIGDRKILLQDNCWKKYLNSAQVIKPKRE